MMPYLAILKILAPILLFFAAIGGAWIGGERHVQKQWDLERAQIIAESNLIKETAAKNAILAQAKTVQLEKHIAENSNANRTIIESLASRDTQLIINRVQQPRPASRCSGVPKVTAVTEGSSETSAASWELSEGVGIKLVAESKRADELAETLRACQAYVFALPEIMK